jgi:hypothetical protein
MGLTEIKLMPRRWLNRQRRIEMFKDMTETELNDSVSIFCEFVGERVAALFRKAVRERDVASLSHLVNVTTGSLKRQLTYATEKAAYGPTARSEYASAKRVVSAYTSSSRERLYAAHEAAYAIYHWVKARACTKAGN